jgi:hypothetical protein
MKHEVVKLVEFFIRQGFKGQGGHKAAARLQVNGMRAILPQPSTGPSQDGIAGRLHPALTR